MKKLGRDWLVGGSVDAFTAPERKPWQETWTADNVVDTIRDADHRRLAAAAPEMARALLEVLVQMGRVDMAKGMRMLKESIEAALDKAGVEP